MHPAVYTFCKYVCIYKRYAVGGSDNGKMSLVADAPEPPIQKAIL